MGYKIIPHKISCSMYMLIQYIKIILLMYLFNKNYSCKHIYSI